MTRRVFYTNFSSDNMVSLADTPTACNVRGMEGPEDDYATVVARRFREQLVAHDYPNETQAAKEINEKQQWLSARLCCETAWKLTELHRACQVLGLDYMYVVTGQRSAGNHMSAGELMGQMRDIYVEYRRLVPDESQDWSQSFFNALGEKPPTVRRGKNS